MTGIGDELQREILDYYFNLPLVDQVSFIWGESDAIRAGSPIAGRPEVEVGAHWGDLEDWFTDLIVTIRFPRRRFRLFRESLSFGIFPLTPPDYWAHNLNAGDEELDDRRFYPSIEEAFSILDGDDPDRRVGEALLAIGRRRPSGGLDRVRLWCDSGEPAVRLIAYGAAAWHFDDESRQIVSAAENDENETIRNFASDYRRILEEDAETRDWVLGIPRDLPDEEPRR